ncbi:unnamed protein product, partial [Angiostrongylus costaricensis]|uniref:G_PROTEIN_RECEP_F1_2 domain-containing protein n=1 Tax=Angiostrongylus costaricensis TaxID=334426 RepID=A0A0R3PCW3_ANGCS
QFLTLTSSINFYLFGALSIIFNATLIYVLLKRSLTPIGTYKYLMIASSLLDVLFSFTTIFAHPVRLQGRGSIPRVCYRALPTTTPQAPCIYIYTYIYIYARIYIHICLIFKTVFALRQLDSVLIIGDGFILPRQFTVIAVILSLLLLYQSILIPPCLFIFRYLQICR